MFGVPNLRFINSFLVNPLKNMTCLFRGTFLFPVALIAFALLSLTSPSLAKTPKGSLAISTNPPGAELVFNSEKMGVTPIVVKLTKKINRIVLRKSGYKTYDALLEKNTAWRKIVVNMKLEGVKPQQGVVEPPEMETIVDSLDPFGLSDSVEDTVGRVPPAEPPPEVKLVSAAAPAIVPAPANVMKIPEPVLPPEPKTEDPKVEAQPVAKPAPSVPKGSLAILSEPVGAEVLFNSEKKGPTPVVVELTKKLNRIVVKLRGYKTYDAMIEQNTLRRTMTVALTPEGGSPVGAGFKPAPTGEIVAPVPAPTPPATPVVTTPPAVVVKPEPAPVPEPVAQTPKVEPPIEPEAEKTPPPVAPSVPSAPVKQFPLPAEETHASMELGMVFFSSSPSRAAITVDGKPTGKQTPVKFGLPVGTHHIEMLRDGLKGETDYKVNRGNNKALLLELQ